MSSIGIPYESRRDSHSKAPPSVQRRNSKTEVSLWKRVKCFPFTIRRRHLKTQQSPAILDLSGKSRDYRDVMVFVELRFQVFSVHTKTHSRRFQNTTDFKSVYERRRFRDGSVWTVGLTVDIKLHFSNFSVVVWTLTKSNVEYQLGILYFCIAIQ